MYQVGIFGFFPNIFSKRLPGQNDLENGNGTFLWADGYRYTGAFVEGLKTGYGEYYYKNGDSYKGLVKPTQYSR